MNLNISSLYICISISPVCISVSPNLRVYYIRILISLGCIYICISKSPDCISVSHYLQVVNVSVSQYLQVVNCYSSRLSNYYKLHDCMRPKAYLVTLIQAVQTILGRQHQVLLIKHLCFRFLCTRP